MRKQFAKYSLVLLMVMGLFQACEKNITVDIPKAEKRIVVEGYVEKGRSPIVQLSYSSSYFDALDSNSIKELSIKGAIVKVNDGTTEITLTELDPTQGYLYLDLTNSMIGTEGKTYTLYVEIDGKVVTASTKLTGAVPLDSVWYKVDGNRDSLGFIWAKLSDPDTLGNAYRWFAKRVNKDSSFIPPPGSVFEDKFINGKSFDFAYNRGSVPNEEEVEAERGYFKRGDTVVVKFCTMDQDHFKFWRSQINQAQSNGNPFSSPAPIESNITGGLGVWGAYTPSYDTVIAQ